MGNGDKGLTYRNFLNMELNIEQFNPKKAELQALAQKYSGLKIMGIDDKEGQAAVYAARIDLKNTRVALGKTGKAMREEANAFAAKVIEVEKSLISITEPLEKEFERQEEIIELEKKAIKDAEAKKVQEALNIRIEAFRKVETGTEPVMTSFDIQVMSEDEFQGLLAFQTDKFEKWTAENARIAEVARLQKEADDAARIKLAEDQRILAEAQAKLVTDQKKIDDEKSKTETAKSNLIEFTKKVTHSVPMPESGNDLVREVCKQDNTMEIFAKTIHDLADDTSNRAVMSLLLHLSGTLGKMYDNEGQLYCLIENCEEWKKNPSCFN